MVLQDKIKYQKALQALLQKISYGFQHYSKGMTDMINQRLHQCIKHLKLNLCLYKSNNKDHLYVIKGECPMTTLISHFYNEEYLLPWWLMHHTKLFDHGILINRSSTDRSVEICQQYAPHWEIRNSKVLEFDAIQVDHEVMDIEKEVTGWKMTLNTTEFLCCRDKIDFFFS